MLINDFLLGLFVKTIAMTSQTKENVFLQHNSLDGFNVHSDGIHFYFGQYINDRVDPFLGNLASGPRFCLFLILEQKLFSFLKKVF